MHNFSFYEKRSLSTLVTSQVQLMAFTEKEKFPEIFSFNLVGDKCLEIKIEPKTTAKRSKHDFQAIFRPWFGKVGITFYQVHGFWF